MARSRIGIATENSSCRPPRPAPAVLMLEMEARVGAKQALLVDTGIGAAKLNDFVKTLTRLPVIVVNTAGGGVRAFSAICTHLGCVVEWNKGKGVIQSPCHDGRFNPLTGAVVSGPPPRGLPPYELSIKDGKIFVGKPLGQIFGA